MNSVKDTLKNPWIKLLGIILAICLFGWIVYLVRDVLIPFALALIVAYILDPVVDILERRKIPRTLAIALLCVGLFAALAGGAVMIMLDIQAAVAKIPDEQASPKSADKPESTADGEPAEPPNDPTEDKSPKDASREEALSESTDEPAPGGDDEAPESLQEPVEEQSTDEWIKAELASLTNYLPKRFRPHAVRAAHALYDYLAPRLHGIVTGAGDYVAEAAKSAFGFISWIFQFALFVVVTLYLLKDIDKMREKYTALLPPQYKPDIIRIAGKIDGDLRKFFRGQLLVALVLTVMYLIGLLIAGVPYALPVAIIGGLGNFIPYLGTFLGVFSGVTASVAGHGFDIHILYVIIVFGVGQVLEGNIITPRIVGKSVGLSPVAIIFSILVFGKLLGFFGVLFAIPLASTVRVFAGELLPRLGLPTGSAPETPPPEEATLDENKESVPDG